MRHQGALRVTLRSDGLTEDDGGASLYGLDSRPSYSLGGGTGEGLNWGSWLSLHLSTIKLEPQLIITLQNNN